MSALTFWLLIIECVTVQIKVVYGTDRVIITIPVHVKKTHHTRTIYKIIEKPVAAGLRINRRPQTTAPGEPDTGRPHVWYGGGGGGGGETPRDADADSPEAQRQSPSHHDRGNAAATGYRDRGHGASGGDESHASPYARVRHKHAGGEPYGHKPRVIHVVGGHKHGHYAGVMYVGDHEPERLGGQRDRHAYPVALHKPASHAVARHKPAYPGAGDHAQWPPRHGARMAPVRFRAAAPVVVPPPPRPHHHDQNAIRDDGGYQVQENVAESDDRPPPTTPDPLRYVTVSPVAGQHSIAAGLPLDGMSPPPIAVSPQQAVFAPQHAVLTSQQTAVAPQHAVLTSQQTAFASPQTAFASPQSAFASPHTAFASPQSAFASPHTAFASPQSAFASPQSAFASSQSAVSHVYYTLDPVVPYDDVPWSSK